MSQLQTFLHELEEGAGKRLLRLVVLAGTVLLLVILYNRGAFTNMKDPDAMDSAQIARNIKEGRGFTTGFIRPFSIYLIKKNQDASAQPGSLDVNTDPGLLSAPHPDISTAPLYPLTLAGLMKVVPSMDYQPAGNSPVNLGKLHLDPWNNANHFWIYGPDFLISLFNQCLMLLCAVMIYRMANSLFDPMVAWTATVVFVGTDLFWRFSMSGLSTILLMTLFLGLSWCLLILESRTREATDESMFCRNRQLLMAGAIGGLAGLACLTRYSFGWVLIPVLIFLGLSLTRNRIPVILAVVAAFALIVTPWAVRNHKISGHFFGTASYSVVATTQYFPEYKLERSMAPELGRVRENHIWEKFLTNAGNILQNEVPRMTGNWVAAFFLVGLMVRFQNTTLNRFRFFLLGTLGLLVILQALCQTQTSVDRPMINSENLLVIAAPLLIIFGASFFYSLLDQLSPPGDSTRNPLIGLFALLMCLPAVATCMSARSFPIAYPPYWPPLIQKVSDYMKPDEMMMSDIPWAVAWYGRHPCIWLTVSPQCDFTELNKHYKPIQGLYLTPVTMDTKFLSQGVSAGEDGWGTVALNIIFKGELPKNFPLTHAPTDYLPEQMFLSDKVRWGLTTPPAETSTNAVNTTSTNSTAAAAQNKSSAKP